MNRGILYALAAALLFGLSTPLAKLALDSSPPLLVAGLLYLGSGLGLAMVHWIRSTRRSEHREAPLARADLPWFAGAILAGGVIAPTLLLFGLLSTTASAASLLLNLEAVATAAIAWWVFRENVDRRVSAGFVALATGATPSRASRSRVENRKLFIGSKPSTATIKPSLRRTIFV